VAWLPWPLTLEVVRDVTHGVENLPAHYAASATCHCRVMGKRVKLKTWRYNDDVDLGGYRACRWCNPVPSLNFVGLHLQKTWRIFRLTSNRPRTNHPCHSFLLIWACYALPFSTQVSGMGQTDGQTDGHQCIMPRPHRVGHIKPYQMSNRRCFSL